MEQLLTNLTTVLVSVMASSGFWAYLSKRSNKKSAASKMLRGLAHDRIIYLGMKYIHRGWISKDEYDDLIRNLYGPYKEMGGNGLAERVVKNINSLPFKKQLEEDKDEG